MKNLKYTILVLVCGLFASCMDSDWDAPSASEAPYGNNKITETNVITIAQLKTKYKSAIDNGDTARVTENIQIKGRITGNDIGGNIYNEVSLQDETGAIIVCISQSGIYGYLPVGQEILIDLKDLYVGGYGKQAEIGTPFTNSSGSTYVSRMNKFIWQNQFKIIATPTIPEITPIDFTTNLNISDNCGQLVTLKNVTLTEADGKAVFAPNDGSVPLTANCANRAIKEMGASVVLRTSTYADFANMVMPKGKVNITGIATRFNNTWQILMRSESDIKTVE
jgi:DNA/RNA endonuclease YhcR with UshA esterase domain